MQEILKKVYLFKFTLIYSVGFFYLGGLLLGLPAFICGLIVDTCIMYAKSKPRYRKDGTEIRNHGDCAGYWFGFLIIVGFGYTYLVFSNYHAGGVIYNWMKFTEPFTAEMATHIAFIEVYPKKIASVVGAWHEPVMRHLYAIFWFTNIVALPLAFSNITGRGDTRDGIDYNQYWLNEIDTQKNKFGTIMAFNILMILIVLMGVLYVPIIVDHIYSGDSNFSKSIYAKKYYIFYPFWNVLIALSIRCFVTLITINKELIRRKFNG